MYRAADSADPYWQLDTLGGHGVRTVDFTTYGPLLADPSVLASRTSAGTTGWVATAHYRSLTTDGIDALREASAREPEVLRKNAVFGAGATVRTALPAVLDRTGRALLVSRSTLMIVSVQLVLLAGYALLLVARLLDTERAGETDLLKARGASRRRITGLAVLEALLLAVPAAVGAALVSGPLVRLLARWSIPRPVRGAARGRSGAPGVAGRGRGRGVLRGGGRGARAGRDGGCAAAAAACAGRGGRGAGAGRGRRGAAVDRGGGVLATRPAAGSSGGGALSRDRAGDLGIDPLLVAAPALALLAGTVLTLRLLPLGARLAERRAASGRGLPAALAGWQFSRRPLRGAGPVLLLVLAVTTGMLAIGQSASWQRSQGDQADLRDGCFPCECWTAGRAARPDRSVRRAARGTGRRSRLPRHHGPLRRSQGDGARSGHGARRGGDIAARRPRRRARGTAAAGSRASGEGGRTSVSLPDGTRRLALDLRITDEPAATGGTTAAGGGAKAGRSPSGLAPLVTVVVEDSSASRTG